jgi:hypothetical protein
MGLEINYERVLENVWYGVPGLPGRTRALLSW